MRDAELIGVVEDLQSRVGARVTGAWQPARDRVIVGLGEESLLIVPRGSFPRLHLIDTRPKNPARPFSFQGALRAHLTGALTQVAVTRGEREVDLRFGEIALRSRFTGRTGGLWLMRGDQVLAAYDGPAPEALPPLAPRPVERSSSPRFVPDPGESWNDAARRWFGAAELRERRTRELEEARTAVRRERKRVDRLLQNLQGDLARADAAPAIRRSADALAAVLHTVKPGTERVSVADLEEDGVIHHLTLPRDLPPGRFLDELYRKAKRLERSAEAVLRRLEEVEARARALDGAVAALDPDDADPSPYLHLVPRRGHRSQEVPAEGHHAWSGPAGERVLVGRNAAGNRRLTFQIARGSDWWLHLRDAPSAHVVVPIDRGHSPPLELLLAAAQILLRTSKVPVGASADVQYTQVKNVRSIPGDNHVRVSGEKVLRVTRDDGVLVGWTRE